MKITVLGIGDAFSAKSYSSCFIVEHEGRRLLVDCPHPIRKILRESANLDVMDIDAIVLTHLHADHASGLEGFAFFSRIVLSKPARIITNEKVQKEVWNHCSSAMGCMFPSQHVTDAARIREYQLRELPRYQSSNSFAHPNESVFFQFHLVPDDEETSDESIFHDDISVHRSVKGRLRFDPFELRCRRTIHHIPTFAWKITAGGKTLAYSADTCFSRELIDWLADGSDLIIHESNLGPHTPYEMLLELPEEILSKMHLIHCPDDFIAEKLPMLAQGQIIEL
jgi:ribonuclease BN (tRNA processing enzyme)